MDVRILSKVVGVATLIACYFFPQPAPADGWFWKEVPAQIKDGSRSHALATVQARVPKGLPLPVSRKRAGAVLRRWYGEISVASRRANVPPALMTAIVVVESAGRPDAVSQAGAQGLAQLMPGTAERFGVRNAFDPAQNLRGASSYLSFVLRRFRNDWVLALAAYNAGEGAVDKHGGVPPFRETRAYIPKVLSAYALLTTMISQDEAKQYDWFWKAVPAKLKAGKRSDALNVVRDEQARGRKVFGSQRSIGRILKKWRKAATLGLVLGPVPVPMALVHGRRCKPG